MKNYRVANVKPDEEYKVDFRIAGEKDAIRTMVKKYQEVAKILGKRFGGY